MLVRRVKPMYINTIEAETGGGGDFNQESTIPLKQEKKRKEEKTNAS